jgi:hypothetical protein
MIEKRGRVFSFGGGVQSHAVMVLQAQGKLERPYDAFIFANVGEDSENPDTLAYLERYTKPFAEEHNITLLEVRRKGRTVKQEAMRQDTKSVVIPAYKGQGGPAKRDCTTRWKINEVDRAIRALEYTHCEIGLGISYDEPGRIRSEEWHDRIVSKSGKTVKKFGFWKKREYVLFHMGITRLACNRIIGEAGLPQPPKSSCYFCPFHKPSEWLEMKISDPPLFGKAIEVENALNNKGLPGDPYFLHTYKKPLAEAVSDQQMLPMDLECEDGYCNT